MTVSRIAAAVFVKTPGYSPLKTRLAADLGSSNAEEFHRLAVKCIEENLTQTRTELSAQGTEFTPCWAVAEDSALEDPLWSHFPTLSQGSGGLGARMQTVYSRLLEAHDAVLLIGADSPQLTPQILISAVASLAQHEFVLGPSHDGGFYLFGGRLPIPLAAWERVPYSVAETTKLMTTELRTMGRVEQLEPLTDVDTLQDLPRLLSELLPSPQSTAQNTLLSWIESQLKTEL